LVTYAGRGDGRPSAESADASADAAMRDLMAKFGEYAELVEYRPRDDDIFVSTY